MAHRPNILIKYYISHIHLKFVFIICSIIPWSGGRSILWSRGRTIRKGTAPVFFTYGEIGELSESKLLHKEFLGEPNDGMLSLQILNHAPHSIHFWCRFIDDCFFIFTHGNDKLHEVLTFMNVIHSTIKFTFILHNFNIDTSIHIGQGGKMFSKVYTKPTDTFPLLEFKSKPSSRNKIINIYSQARRYRLLTSYDEDLTKSLLG